MKRAKMFRDTGRLPVEEDRLIVMQDMQRALKNAHAQRRRVEMGKPVRVRPEYWEQVARDYQRELKSIS